MIEIKANKQKRAGTSRRARPEPPFNVILHNDWDNSMPWVVVVLKKAIPGMSFARAAAIMYRAHSAGKATVKRCHKELAELYSERLQSEGLTASIEPSR